MRASPNLHSVVVLATAWGPSYGGINSFNFDFCRALARILPPSKYRLACVVPASPSPAQTTVTDEVKVLSVETGATGQLDPLHSQQVLKALTDEGLDRVDWWMGHDLHTGPIAKRCQKESKVGRLAIFHHVNYLVTSALKGKGGDTATKRRRAQVDLFGDADKVFAIGPKLAENARALVAKRPKAVIEILPGLAEPLGTVRSSSFKVCTLGRMSPSDDLIKQGRLGVAALSTAVSTHRRLLGDDPVFALIGLDPTNVEEQQRDLQELSFSHAKRLLPVLGISYLDSREQIFEQIADSDVCLMLSLHEGFGLAGWEAIGLEVPLIVGQNSGLYRLISQRLKGEGLGCIRGIDIRGGLGDDHYSPDDLKAVHRAILDIASDREDARANAKKLREKLSLYTWQACAIDVANSCSIPTAYLPGEEEAGQYVREILDHNIDEIQGSRIVHLEQIGDRLTNQPEKVNRLIIFGGVATQLRDNDAAVRYATWLIRNPAATLFICFESGPAAEARAATLDPTKLELAPMGLPPDPVERMKAKEEAVRNLYSRLGDLVAGKVLARATLIPLSLTLTTYLILTDADLYISPVLQVRSTLAPSFRISNPASPHRRQFLEFMLHHLNASPEGDGVETLMRDLKADLQRFDLSPRLPGIDTYRQE